MPVKFSKQLAGLWRQVFSRSGIANAPSSVVWLTGLSGAGKTTIARETAEALRRRGGRVEVLDGDVIRGLFPVMGFSRTDREIHTRHVGFVASCLERHGVVVIVALISPYRASREFARRLCRNFVEVHVSTPVEVCEARDPKGLYAKARGGLISGFTGIDDPYEPPIAPDLVVDTSTMTIDEAAGRVLNAIVSREGTSTVPHQTGSGHVTGVNELAPGSSDPLLQR